MKSHYPSTTDYSQFKFKVGNRPVLPCRVQCLKESITQNNKLHLHPIIVDKNNNIVDGQHRLAAANSLRVPIYYIVDYESQEDDIILFNTHRTNWSLENYVNYHNQKGIESFVFFQKMIDFCKTYHAPFSSVYRTLAELCASHNTYFPDLIRSGKLEFKNKEIAKKFIELTFPACKKLNDRIKHLRERRSCCLFFKSSYISTLIFCFIKMTLKQYKELLRCLERDVSKLSDTNSHTEVYALFKMSYCHKKNKEGLKKDFNFDLHKIQLQKTDGEES
jgi:hypothetical protein